MNNLTAEQEDFILEQSREDHYDSLERDKGGPNSTVEFSYPPSIKCNRRKK